MAANECPLTLCGCENLRLHVAFSVLISLQKPSFLGPQPTTPSTQLWPYTGNYSQPEMTFFFLSETGLYS